MVAKGRRTHEHWLPKREIILIWLTPFLIIFLAYLLFMPITGNYFSLYVKSAFDPKIILGLRISELSEEEVKGLKLEPWQSNYYQRFDIVPVTVSLDFIFIPSKFQNQEFCISELSIVVSGIESVYGNPKRLESKLFDAPTPYCLEKDLQTGTPIVLTGGEMKAFDYQIFIPSLWYPFDSRYLKIDSLLVKGTFDEDIVFDPAIQITNTSPRWIAWISKYDEPKGDSKHWEVTSMQITVARHSLYRVLAILMPFIVGFILLKISPLAKNNKDSFWEIIVGLILGLWSLSEVLIPNYIDHPTLIGNIILFLYVPFVLYIVFMNVTAKNNRRDFTTSNKDQLVETYSEQRLSRIAHPSGQDISDNLELLTGIGPKIAMVLRRSGITTFRDLGNEQPESVRQVLKKAGLKGLQLLEVENWIMQARLLAKFEEELKNKSQK